MRYILSRGFGRCLLSWAEGAPRSRPAHLGAGSASLLLRSASGHSVSLGVLGPPSGPELSPGPNLLTKACGIRMSSE